MSLWLGLAITAAVFLIGASVGAQVVLIPTNAVWKYLDNGSDQGTAWRMAGFPDTAWGEGPAELGFGDGPGPEFRPEATLLSPGPLSPNQHITYYFRHRFTVTGAAAVTNLQARVIYDDGAVIYLNGTEAARPGMNPGPVNHLTLAASPGVSGDAEFAYVTVPISPGLILEGENVMSVEVHQLSGSSSDLSFAMELLVITNIPSPPPPSGITLVVPRSVLNVGGGYGAGTLSAANLRLQEVYGAVNFPPDIALWITELRFRPDVTFGRAFSTTIANIQINLSTTTRLPGGLVTTYADNVGADDTIVHSGPLSLSSQFAGPPGGPKNFDIIIPLTTPFLYDPGAGNLLLDIRNSSGSSASPLSGQNSASDSASRVAGSVASLTANGVDSGIDALQLVYYLTNPPPRPPAPTLLLRNPYLQRGTQTNILACWRTSVKTNSLVSFGLTAGALNWQVDNSFPTNNHYALLTNLAPNTKYFYSIGAAGTNLAGGPDHFFITSPAGPKPTRIWAIGDFGTYPIYGTGSLAVRDGYYNYAGQRHTDVWLMLGDNAYSVGEDFEFQRALFDIYPDMLRKTVSWSTIGNHETYAPDATGHIAYYDIYKAPTAGEAGGIPSGTLRYYSFDYGNIHFVCLDSELSSHAPNGPMATWLRADLEANSRDWLIAFWHSPPYTKGSHDSDNDADTDGHLKNMREVFVPILEAYGVDLVLGGHSHNYERSFLLDGHYGKSWTLQPSMKLDAGSGRPEETGAYVKPTGGPEANQGAVYIVAGSSGFATSQVGQHPAMYASILRLGSLVLDIDGSRLDGKFLRDTGAIEDTFTIIKGTAPGPLRFAKIQMANGRVTAQFKTIPGRTYRVERTSSLETPAWASISGNITAVEHTTIWSAPAVPGTEKSFYRVVQVD